MSAHLAIILVASMFGATTPPAPASANFEQTQDFVAGPDLPAKNPRAHVGPVALNSAPPAESKAPEPAASIPTNFGVFQSMAISADRLPAAAKWHDVTRGDYTALFSANCAASALDGCESRLATRVRGIVSRASGLSDTEKLDSINRAVNTAMTYRSDRNIWGVGDYWATPVEMAQKGAGDCEDFAIAKYWALRSLGIADDQMQLVVLQDTRRQLPHAVLVVHTASGAYVLDNVTSGLRLDTAYGQYQPIMSFSGQDSYIHGFSTGSTAVAALQ